MSLLLSWFIIRRKYNVHGRTSSSRAGSSAKRILTSLSVDVFARNQKSFGFLADPLDGDDLATVLAYQKEQGNGSATMDSLQWYHNSKIERNV